jgi:alpha-glucosidase
VQDAVLAVMRFWLERGVDGFRFDTVNFYFHDDQLRDNPPANRPSHLPLAAINPYDMQEHVYSKSRPVNVGFLKRMRKLMDEFPGTTTVGEVGDSDKPLELMAEYTSGGDKLHMCYAFEFLGEPFSASHVRTRLEAFFGLTRDGWPCWSFSNHDVDRHVSRWAKHGASRDSFARLCGALLATLKGTICVYQGAELGLPQAELLFEELTDPPGIRFWPEYKGRDGCRTPIPWETGEPPNGFTRGKPWLPVKPEHAQLSVAVQDADPGSVLNFYRRMLAWRRGHEALVSGDIVFLDTAEPVLAFRRAAEAGTVLCVFNLSPGPVSVTLGGAGDGTMPDPLSQGATLAGTSLALDGSGYALIAEPAGTALGVRYSA